MGSTVEKIEKNVATVKMEVSAEDFNKAVNQSYNKNKGKFNVPGFRKGKAPRKVIEAQYGANVFYEDAIDFAFPEAYNKAVEEHELFPVSRPSMESLDTIDAQEGLVMTISVAVKPEVELGEYKGAEIESLDYVVTDEDINAELEKIQSQNGRLVSVEEGTAAKEQDTAVIDFEGFVDEVAFEGGKGENYNLVLGSKQFIPGFEEQLIGAKVGEEVDVKVTFPEEYHAADLAGKEAIFKVKVNEIKTKELPEIDDEFVKDISEFDTLDEYKQDLKAKLQETKTNELKEEARNKAVKFAVDNATVEIPKPMVDEEIDKTIENFSYRMQMQGISMEDYFRYTNSSEEAFRESARGDVENQIKTDLVLTKITEVENIQATEEEIAEAIEEYAKSYNMEADKMKETMTDSDKEYFQQTVKRKNVIAYLVENAVQKN